MSAPLNRAVIFAELAQSIKLEKFDTGQRLASQLLEDIPEDEDAFVALLFCLIRCHRFDDVVDAANAHPQFSSVSAFQKAYALYRLNKLDEALAALRAGESDNVRFKELEGQIQYKAEGWKAAWDIYTALLTDTGDKDEHLTNQLASQAGCAAAGLTVQAIKSKPPQTYEQLYNAACLAIANQNMQEAEDFLNRAMPVCRNELAQEGFSAVEIEEELTVLNVQLAVVYQLTGRPELAKPIYRAMLQKRGDKVVTAVAANNSAILQGGRKSRQSRKAAGTLLDSSVAPRLTSFQNRALKFNKALFLYHEKQYEACLLECKGLAVYGTWEMTLLLEASCLVKLKKNSEAVELLQAFIANHGPSAKVHRALIQLAIEEGRVENLVETLAETTAANPRPDLVAATATVLEYTNQIQAAADTYSKAAAYHRNQSNPVDLAAVLKAQVSFLEQHNQPGPAAAAYEELLQLEPANQQWLAKLVSLYADLDLEKAESYARQLPSLDSAIAEVDVLAVEMEKLGIGAQRSESSMEPSVEYHKKRNKRKGRKGKLPKDPTAPLDSERWLPKWERSYYRKRHRNKNIARGPQGAAASSQPSTTGSSGKRAVSVPVASQGQAAQQDKAAPQSKRKTGAKAKKGGRRGH